MKTIQVAAAVIRDGERVFATQRGYGDYKDYWEFPGGKLEPGETARAALVREIREELDTVIEVGALLTTVEYDYPGFHLHMDCFWASVLEGGLRLKEHEAARWLRPEELDAVAWLPADRIVVEALRRSPAPEAEAPAGTPTPAEGGGAALDPFVDERDFELLRQDPFTFAVLARILQKPCSWIRSDHSRRILCHSEPPYPVWIWTADGLGEAEKAAVLALTEALCPLSAGYRINLKHELAEYLLAGARRAGLEAGIVKQLFAYDCPEPLPPVKAADGALRRCTEADLPELLRLLPRFYAEIGEHVPAPERIAERASAKLAQGSFFVWEDAGGKTVACCAYTRQEGLTAVNDVYTLPEARRKHYAQNLVYGVTKLIRGMGELPMLYTNAEYPASNACYRQIGYRLQGKLCTIARRD